MKPSAKNPIILYINACDVSLKSNAPPDRAYVEQMRKPTHGYSVRPTIGWPTMPPGDYRIGVRPPVSQHGTFKQNPFLFELRQASKDARTLLELKGIVVGNAPPEMFKAIKEEEEENNNEGAAAGAAAGAGKQRKRNNTCKKKGCPKRKSRRKSVLEKASRSSNR